jgi:hypothetical protein
MTRAVAMTKLVVIVVVLGGVSMVLPMFPLGERSRI